MRRRPVASQGRKTEINTRPQRSFRNSNAVHPDAWCSACDARQAACGYKWIGDALEHLEPKVVCGSCYEAMKTFHMGGNPWS